MSSSRFSKPRSGTSTWTRTGKARSSSFFCGGLRRSMGPRENRMMFAKCSHNVSSAKPARQARALVLNNEPEIRARLWSRVRAEPPQLHRDAGEERDQHAGGDDVDGGLHRGAPHELNALEQDRMSWMVSTASLPPSPTSFSARRAPSSAARASIISSSASDARREPASLRGGVMVGLAMWEEDAGSRPATRPCSPRRWCGRRRSSRRRRGSIPAARRCRPAPAAPGSAA